MVVVHYGRRAPGAAAAADSDRGGGRAGGGGGARARGALRLLAGRLRLRRRARRLPASTRRSATIAGQGLTKGTHI